MRNAILIHAILLISVSCFSQTTNPPKNYDFNGIDFQKIKISKIEKEQRKIKDSLSKTASADSLDQLLELARQKTSSFDAITLGIGFPSAQIDKINHELSAKGYPLLSSDFTEFRFGLIHKQKRWINEFMANISLNHKSEFNQTTMKLMEGSIGYTIGYDFLNLPRICIYPFAGLNFQGGQLTIDQQNNNSSDPSTLLGTAADYSKTTIMKYQLNGTTGAEMDFYILRPKKENETYITAGAFCGLSTLLIDGKYKANNHHIDYYPDWSFRNTYWGFCVKIGG
ncbi:MAG TPA: hypothetical protein VMI12_15760 [Puia sp.]|nr:hypothetical protein [Puia sp.]